MSANDVEMWNQKNIYSCNLFACRGSSPPEAFLPKGSVTSITLQT